MSDPSKWVEGGCHCGEVAFRARLRTKQAIRCNCTVCAMKGFVHVLVEEEDFELLQGSDALTTYTFGTHTAKHHFCARCGIHSFYRPRSHPDKIDVNLRCLRGVNDTQFEVTQFDGQNWEDNVRSIERF